MIKCTDVIWTAKVNYMYLECGCGNTWYHRVDRFSIVCPKCGKETNKNMVALQFDEVDK